LVGGRCVTEYLTIGLGCHFLLPWSSSLLNSYGFVASIVFQFCFVSAKVRCIQHPTKFIFVKDRPGHDLRYSLNSSKIKRHLKWRCKYNFDKEIKKIIIWYIDKFNKNFFKIKNFRNRIGLKV